MELQRLKKFSYQAGATMMCFQKEAKRTGLPEERCDKNRGSKREWECRAERGPRGLTGLKGLKGLNGLTGLRGQGNFTKIH